MGHIKLHGRRARVTFKLTREKRGSEDTFGQCGTILEGGKTEKRVPYRKYSIYRKYAYVHPQGTLNKFLKLDVIGYL